MGEQNAIDFKMRSEILSGLDRTEKLLASRILWENEAIYSRSVLIEVLINMKDLLVKANKLGGRVSFTDDVVPDPNPRFKIIDVTDLISNYRDAACHNDSYRREFNNGILSFNTIVGKGVLLEINGIKIGSFYEDDIAYNIGEKILYLKRHIERAFQEVQAFLRPIVENQGLQFPKS